MNNFICPYCGISMQDDGLDLSYHEGPSDCDAAKEKEKKNDNCQSNYEAGREVQRAA